MRRRLKWLKLLLCGLEEIKKGTIRERVCGNGGRREVTIIGSSSYCHKSKDQMIRCRGDGRLLTFDQVFKCRRELEKVSGKVRYQSLEAKFRAHMGAMKNALIKFEQRIHQTKNFIDNANKSIRSNHSLAIPTRMSHSKPARTLK